MTHKDRISKWFENNPWIKNYHKLSFMYANGFIGEKTYSDLIGMKIRKFNGELGRMNKTLEEHYSK